MTDESPTERLREEHQLILQVTGVLDSIVSAAEGGKEPDLVSLDRCISFFRLFVDAFHHGKEEDVLFPEMGKQGVPYDGGPIAMMLYEHGQGRALIRQMAESLPEARRGDDGALGSVVAAGRAYIDLIRGHIGKEDMIVFEMADQVIPGGERVRLCGAYDAVAGGMFEGNTREDLVLIAAGLLKQYPQAGGTHRAADG
jgi:hemerythrin-like domain-containing protein